MHDFAAWRKATIRFWERRRIGFNLLLILPAFLGWALAGAMSAAVGDKEYLAFPGIFFLFLLGAIGANVCYSFVYVLEFIFGSDDSQCGWNVHGRNAIFVLGSLLSIILALIGGRNIAIAQYSGIRFF